MKDTEVNASAVTLSARKRPGRRRNAASISEELPVSPEIRTYSDERECGILNLIPAAIYQCDGAGRISMFNEAAAQLWGRRPEIGTDLWCGSWKIYYPDGRPMPLRECPMAIAIREGRGVKGFEIVVERPDGTRRTVLPFPEPILDGNGAVIGALNTLLDLTEYRDAKRASMHLAAIVESSEDAIVSKNLNSIIQTWNQAAERLFGYKAEEVIGKPVTILIPETQPDEEPAILEKIRAGKRIEHYETIRRRKDGSFVQVSLSVSPIRNSEGKIVGASKIARDITGQKKVEADLRKRSHTLEVINRTSSRLAAELNIDKLLQAVTDAATELSGAQFGAFFYNSKNEKGESYQLFTLSGVPREAFEKFGYPRNTAIFGPTFRGEAVVRYDDVTRSPDYGKSAPFLGMPPGHLPVRSYLAAPVVSRSGEVLGGLIFGHAEAGIFDEEAEGIVNGIAGSAAVALDNAKLYQALERELTEHKRAEAALRQSESQFRSLSELLPQIVWTTSPDGVLEHVNQQAYEFTGGTELTKREKWDEIIHPEDNKKLELTWREALRTGADFQTEYRLKDREGNYRWFLGRAVPVRNEEGEIVKWLGTSTDIDHQKRAEEKLERTVAERTVRLRDTVAELEAFSYSIAHDMRAPLRAMSGFSSLLEEEYSEALPEEAQQYLKRIARSAVRLDSLIQDVLNYSRIARNEMAIMPTNFAELTREILETYPQLQSADISVELDHMSLVMANVAALTQCISNLLSNAVKFVAPGVRPSVRISFAEKQDQLVRILFQDNGIGITEEGQKRIFKMFQRLHPATEFEGTGIGLTIVRKAVERMGGNAGVESKLGQGSSFWLELRKAI
jgi:PAS domain S-box-containing protein